MPVYHPLGFRKVPLFLDIREKSGNIEGDAKKSRHMFGVLFKKLSFLAKPNTVNGQKNFSSALKWGILCLCISYTFRDIVKTLKCSYLSFLDYLKTCKFTK